MRKLSHIDNKSQAQMVDVTAKEATLRRAKACGFVTMDKKTLALVAEEKMAKGSVLGTAKIAGIMAAKRTGEMIPLCHPLELTDIEVNLEIDRKQSRVNIEAEIKTIGRTGVEMEALTAVSVAALTVYDMCKALDKKMVIGGIMLLEKTGGRSGTFIR